MSRIIRRSATAVGVAALAGLLLAGPATAKPGPIINHKTEIGPVVTVHKDTPAILGAGAAAVGGIVIGAGGMAWRNRSQRRRPRFA